MGEMVAGEHRPHWIEFRGADARSLGADVGNSSIQRHRFRSNFTEKATDRLYAWGRRELWA